MELTLNRSDVAGITATKRVSIVAILITLCSRAYKVIVYPILLFLAEIMIMCPAKILKFIGWKNAVVLIVMCVIGIFLLINAVESMHIMNG